MSKILLSVRIDETLYRYLERKPNKSRYIEGLVRDDFQVAVKRPIVEAVKQELLQDEVFLRECVERMKTTEALLLNSPIVTSEGSQERW